jgi:hypothetical protein
MWRQRAAWLGARSTRATRIRLVQLGTLAFSIGIAACGGTAASTSAPIAHKSESESGAALIKAPAAVGAVCSKLTRSVSFTVMCPTAWPRTAGAGEPQVGVLATTQATYLVNAFNGLSEHSAHIFHLLFGGQNTSFDSSLGSIDPGLRVTTRDVRIPKTGGGTFVQQLAVRYIGSSTVHHRHARLLQEPPYPQGGVQGGHVLVLWNESGHGYLVPVHGQGLTKPELIAAATDFADSTSPG